MNFFIWYLPVSIILTVLSCLYLGWDKSEHNRTSIDIEGTMSLLICSWAWPLVVPLAIIIGCISLPFILLINLGIYLNKIHKERKHGS